MEKVAVLTLISFSYNTRARLEETSFQKHGDCYKDCKHCCLSLDQSLSGSRPPHLDPRCQRGFESGCSGPKPPCGGQVQTDELQHEKRAFVAKTLRYFDTRGWGGLKVARLHYLSPHLLYILADFATIATPNTYCLMVFQVVTNVAEKAKPASYFVSGCSTISGSWDIHQ